MPLYNIFKKSEKNKSARLPRIIADIHEKNSLVLSELHFSKQVELEIKSLKIGDYLIGNTIIERKTVSDFISSMINKRLVQQLKQMQRYKQQLLIIEGIDEQEIYRTDTNLNPNAIRGFILSIITNYQVPVLFTQNYHDTSKYLIILAKQQLKPRMQTTLHSKIPRTIKEQKQYVLESFPDIGPVTAKKLLEKFKTISNTINAKEEVLREILKNKAEKFKRLLDS